MKEKIMQFLKGTKIISRILFFSWMFLIIVACISMPESFGIIFSGYTSFLLVPAILIELNNNSIFVKAETVKKKPPLSYRIWGTIFVLLGTYFVLLVVTMMGEDYGGDLWIPLFLGLVICALGVLLLKGTIYMAGQKKRNKGVYLTEEQIEKLEQGIELPVVNTPVFLNYDEIAVYHSRATRQVGNKQYFGDFVITTERIIFLSTQRGFEAKHQNITAATAYKDGFAFQCRNTNYSLLLPRPDLATLAFDGVRTGESSIAGISASDYDEYDDYDYDDDFDNDESDVVSFVDGMEGHEFEYFCANLLEQNGFSDVNVTKGSGDQGVDILATKASIKYAIQCKNYITPLSNTPIQEVTAGKMFYNCHVGVVMTNSTFTPKAQELAQATGVLLWDREVLRDMIENIDVD